MATRDELIGAIATRYSRSSRAEKKLILDEFVSVTGLHRKHAMRLLRRGGNPGRSGPRPSRRTYGEEDTEALVVLWGHRHTNWRTKLGINTLL